MAWYGKDPNDGEIARIEAAKKDLQESKEFMLENTPSLASIGRSSLTAQ